MPPRTIAALLHRRVQLSVLGFIVVAFLCVQPSSHAQPAGFTAEQILTFAEQLMKEGEYFRAVVEYRRFLAAYPEDHRQAKVHFRIGLALYYGQQYEDAFLVFREVGQQHSQTEYGQKALLWQGESLMRQASYGTAAQFYSDIAQRFPGSDTGQYAQFQRAWALLYQRQWHEASQQFQHIDPGSILYPRAQMLAEEVLAGANLSSKSPILAGLLSGIIPGGGQLYNGRPGDALLAFFLNGLFVVGVVESLQQDQQAVAAVLGLVEAGWYVGNVYGAVNGAHKYNRYATETFLRNLENRFRLPPPEAHQGRFTPSVTVLRLGF